MKKIFNLVLSFVGFLITVRLMWNFGIALDEKWTLAEFKSFLGISEFIILFIYLYFIIVNFFEFIKSLKKSGL